MTQQTSRPRIDVQETPTPTTWRSSKSKIAITPRSVMTRRSQKQKRVSPPSASPTLDSKDSVGSVDEAMLATMSRSRSFVRWRSSASTEQSKNGLTCTPIEIDPTSTTPATRSTSSIPDTRTSSTTSDPTTITGTPHADEPHEASDDSDGSISVSSGGHATMNKLSPRLLTRPCPSCGHRGLSRYMSIVIVRLMPLACLRRSRLAPWI